MSDAARSTATAGTVSGSPVRLWPWSAKAALFLAPVILVALVVTIAITNVLAGWPQHRYDGRILLGIVILSLLPVILLFVQTLAASNGSIQLPGVSLSFAGISEAAAGNVRTTTLTENLDTPEDVPVVQTSLRSVLRALRRAHDSDVTVVDLRQGHTWWETRLFILVAGAARRDRPQIIAFVGDRNGRPRVFLGWASPSQLLDMHLSADPTLAEAYEHARVDALKWELGTPAPRLSAAGIPNTPYVTLPWNNTEFYLPSLMDERPDPAFAFELFLQQVLDQQSTEPPKHVTVQRLLQLYEPVLVTDSVDAQAGDSAWAQMLATSPRRFFAVTAVGQFKSLVPRDALVAAMVARLVAAQNEQA
ncbi:hypothetical protein ACFU96_44175 [Streptomyces sp. NPDC057620]|uniref:hypothetical protein n=1 Tax=Streptomyces sp. NPDC057620 TaxID=3346185 RepID=UPI0036738CB4